MCSLGLPKQMPSDRHFEKKRTERTVAERISFWARKGVNWVRVCSLSRSRIPGGSHALCIGISDCLDIYDSFSIGLCAFQSYNRVSYLGCWQRMLVRGK